jgi:DNA-binding NtrC family response regulator
MADVLLVDDDGSVLLTLAIALRRQGHNVTVAGDANQALSHLQRHHFEFLISDVRMPGMSGVELAQQVRRMSEPPRVILTSAYPYVETRGGLAQAFLQKPLDVGQLNELLKSTSSSSGGNSNNGFKGNKPETPPSNNSNAGHRQTRSAQPPMGNLGFATP